MVDAESFARCADRTSALIRVAASQPGSARYPADLQNATAYRLSPSDLDEFTTRHEGEPTWNEAHSCTHSRVSAVEEAQVDSPFVPPAGSLQDVGGVFDERHTPPTLGEFERGARSEHSAAEDRNAASGHDSLRPPRVSAMNESQSRMYSTAAKRLSANTRQTAPGENCVNRIHVNGGRRARVGDRSSRMRWR